MTIQPRSLVILVGASGVGKTTLQRSLDSTRIVLRRVTTRALQHADEMNEMIPVTVAEFEIAKKAGHIILDYEKYGHYYGITNAELERIEPGGLGVIALPAKNISQLRQTLSGNWKVFTCWLAADAGVVNQRLAARADKPTTSTVAQRHKIHSVDHSTVADGILNAHATPEEVQTQFHLWTEKILGQGFGLNPEALLETLDTRIYLTQSTEQWAIFGSMAAQWYARTVYRLPTDVDFILSSPEISHIFRQNPQLALVKPTTLQGKYVELRGRLLTLHVDQERFYWEFDHEAQRRRNEMRIGNFYYPVLSAEDTIIMKCILQRGVDRNKFDLEDVSHMLANYQGRLDLEYLRFRADSCKATARVRSCLSALGLRLGY